MAEDRDLYNEDLYGGKGSLFAAAMGRVATTIVTACARSNSSQSSADKTHSDLDDELDADFDTTQELVDPPDLQPQQSAQAQHHSAQQPVQYPTSTSAPPPAGQAQPGTNGFGAPQDQDGMTGIDRIRPSDMPDEGLVVFLSLDHSKQAVRRYRLSIPSEF